MSQSSGGWFLLLIISVLFSLVTGLAMIWMSIDRADIAFNIGQLQRELNQRTALRDKLEIERDRFLAPGDLRRHAEKFGMHEAGPGQVRHLPTPQLPRSSNQQEKR